MAFYYDYISYLQSIHLLKFKIPPSKLILKQTQRFPNT